MILTRQSTKQPNDEVHLKGVNVHRECSVPVWPHCASFINWSRIAIDYVFLKLQEQYMAKYLTTEIMVVFFPKSKMHVCLDILWDVLHLQEGIVGICIDSLPPKKDSWHTMQCAYESSEAQAIDQEAVKEVKGTINAERHLAVHSKIILRKLQFWEYRRIP